MHGVAILCFHRVLPAGSRGGPDEPYFLRQTAMELPRFCALLDDLQARFEVLAPERLLRWGDLGAAPGSRPRVVLSFDDGYRDVYIHALPELRRRALRALVCVTSDVAAGAQPGFPVDGWYGALTTAARRRGVLDVGASRWSFDLDQRADQQRLIDGPEKRAYLRAGSAQRAVILAALRQALGCPSPPPPPAVLDRADLRALRSEGWLVGSHGQTHALLTEVTAEDALRELTCSRDWLAEVMGAPPRVIAYPDGATSAAVEALAAQAGYQVGLALGSRLAVTSDPALRLPRLIVKSEADWLQQRLGEGA